MKGLHVVQFTVEEFHALIQSSSDNSQILVRGPGLKQGLFFDQRLFSGGQRSLLKGIG